MDTRQAAQQTFPLPLLPVGLQLAAAVLLWCLSGFMSVCGRSNFLGKRAVTWGWRFYLRLGLIVIWVGFVMHSLSFNEVIAPLGDAFRRQADAILDLREYALNQRNPGRCVSCYFKLFRAARGDTVQRLAALRKWLEHNLVVVARDEQERLLERIPFDLNDEDLEAFCQRMAQTVLHDRAYNSKRVELQFAFRGEALAA